MVTKNKVWRPPKMFKPKPKENIIRSRWRPRKHLEKEQRFSQLEEIKKIPISFVANNIRKKSKVDNIALWLLVFSILLFIFSMLFRSNNWEEWLSITQKNNTTQQNNTNKINLNTKTNNQIIQKTGTQAKLDTTNKTQLSVQQQLISDFYKNINDRNFNNLTNLIDIPLKQSNSYKTYYNTERLTNFLNNIPLM